MLPAGVTAWLDATPACLIMLTLHGRTADVAAAATAGEAVDATRTGAAMAVAAAAPVAPAPNVTTRADDDADSEDDHSSSGGAAWTPTFVNQSAREWLGLSAADPPALLLQRLHRADRDVHPLPPTDACAVPPAAPTWSMRIRMRMTDGTFALVAMRANRAPEETAATAAPNDGVAYLCSLEVVHSLSGAFLPPAALSALVSNASSPQSTCSAPQPGRNLGAGPRRVMLPEPASATLLQLVPQVATSVYTPTPVSPADAPTPVSPFPMAASDAVSVSSSGVSVASSTSSSHNICHASSFLSSAVSVSVPPSMPLPSMVLPPETSTALAEDMWHSLPVMLCIILGGRFVRVSPLFERVLGWSESELRAMHVRDIFHPEDVANISVEAVRTNGGSYSPRERPSTREDPMSDTVVINRLREKNTGNYIQCMFRSSLSRQHFAVPPPLHSLSPPGIFSPQVVPSTPALAPAAAPASPSPLSVDAAPASPAGAPAAASVPEPFIHCMIRPMHAQERAALSSALDGIAHQKQEFISNITHELQTPMNGISASAELLAGTELTAEQTDLLSCIQVSAEHMQTIVGDILSFAMVDKGGVTLEHKPLHLNAVVEDSIVLCFRPRLHDHLEILHSIAKDLPAQVLGDVARVRQVLVHLLMNALKFTKQGQIVLRVARYDGSNSPAALIQAQTARLQQLQDDLQAGVLTDEEAADAEAQLAAPQMVVIQPPHQLPSLFSPPPATDAPEHSCPPSPGGVAHAGASGTAESTPTDESTPSPVASGTGSDDRTPFLLEFALSDSGVGIDPRQSSRLFQIFSQGDSSSSKEHQGTGIGLLTSLKLVRQMGGDVWVSSIAGIGSTFFFTIKCTPAVPVSHPTPLHALGTLDHAPALPHPHVSTHTTPLARVRNLVEQEQGRHTRKSSASDSLSSAMAAASMAGFDSPSSTSSSSPHRSPLIAPRFLPSFHTVGVVAANTTMLDVIATDLRSRGASICTFTSCAAALAHAQHSGTVDCWIIDSLTGTQMRRRGSSVEEALTSLSEEPVYATSAGELTGVELVARLLEHREHRERHRYALSGRTTSSATVPAEPEVRVVLLVQSFGLPTSLPLPDSVMNSAHIRLIQVHKPFKHQVLYDAIRTLGDQLSLPLSGGSTSGSERGSGYAMSLMQTKSRRTLNQPGTQGGPNSSIGGDTTSSWATRRVMLGPRPVWSHVPRSSMDMGPPTPLPAGDTPPPSHTSTQLQHTVPVHALSPTAQSPLLPPSPFAHSLIFPSGQQARLYAASSSDSSVSAVAPHASYPVMSSSGSSAAPHTSSNASAPSLPLPRASSVKKNSQRPNLSHINVGAGAGSLLHGSASSSGHGATGSSSNGGSGSSSGSSSAASAAKLHSGSHSPHITTGSARPRSSTTLSASFAKRWPLRILVVEDNLVNMKVCVRILTKLGFTPDQAVDGQEASSKILALARAGRGYDVVLLDLQMPVMDGFECAEIVMREFGCCNMPVGGYQCVHHAKPGPEAWCAALPAAMAYHQLGPSSPPDCRGSGGLACPRPILMALTANTSEEDRSRSFKVGMDEFISKPVSINDIVVPLKKWAKLLSQAHAQGQYPPSNGGSGAPHHGPPSLGKASSSSSSGGGSDSGSSGYHSPHRHSNLLLGRRASDGGLLSGLLSPPAEVNSDAEAEVPSPGGVAAMGRPALSALKSLDALRSLDLGGALSSSSSSNEPSPHLTTLKHPPVVEGNLYSFNSSFPPDPLPASSLTVSSSWSTSASSSSSSAAAPVAPAPSSAPSGPTPSPPASYSSLMLPMSPHSNAAQLPVHRVGPSSSGSGSASTRLVSRHLPPSSRVSATQKSPLLQSRVILNVVRDPSADSVGFVPQHAQAVGMVPLEGPTATRVTVSPVQPKAPGERAPSRSPLTPSPRTLTSFSTESSTNNSPADRVRRTPLMMMDGATNSPSPAPLVHCDAAEPFVPQSSSPADQPCANAQAFLLGLVHKNSK